ncbi:conserved hypothetical protein [Planktothrix serta PCC 8927]|uniref:DUF1269 domain-containing protein n=1 Tax=Planktothrix serta PCC 8927 TaxID=671068 RepID=A0A7Z9BQE4_9CYAN|nr:DUF1269 domain-containing protein [Planktothrix serta]VXD15129.1 conserved hypothetical protein [Planktothrix serta PCC 8927]
MTYSEELTNLVVVAYPEQEKAKEVLKTLKALQAQGVISIVNAAVMVKNEKGKVSISETGDTDAKGGAIMGGITAGLIALFNPIGALGVIALTAGGAGVGALITHFMDLGFPQEDLKELSESLTPGSSAIIALVEHTWVDQLTQALEEYAGRLYKRSIKADIASQLETTAKTVNSEVEPTPAES